MWSEPTRVPDIDDSTPLPSGDDTRERIQRALTARTEQRPDPAAEGRWVTRRTMSPLAAKDIR